MSDCTETHHPYGAVDFECNAYYEITGGRCRACGSYLDADAAWWCLENEQNEIRDDLHSAEIM